ncbi:isoprenylcysteine carboxylmethyltransferase family protein [Akkermansiaceae bacterium]|nr:isoprenylcysteine carboxylmethyltransferase family protein [Akkermansiaceae bacterium]
MQIIFSSIIGIFSYQIALFGLVAFLLYLGAWDFLPLHINSREVTATTFYSIIVNLCIMLLFGLHHSLAARPRFKQFLAKLIPMSVERSIYVGISGLFMFVICLFWQPLAGNVWSTDNTGAFVIFKAIHLTGWLVLVIATFELDHSHLMGLQQSLKLKSAEQGILKERFLYRIVRHPIQTGLLIVLWSTSQMSNTQFMLATSLTVYIFIGLYFEEKALVAQFGDAYKNYKKRVPSVIPFWPRKR